jgi:hypothetical protein
LKATAAANCPCCLKCETGKVVTESEIGLQEIH